MPRNRQLVVPAMLVAFAAVLLSPGGAPAQIRIQPNGRIIFRPGQQGERNSEAEVDVEASVSRALKRAPELLEEGEYDDLFRIVQAVLDRKNDRRRNEQFRESEDYFLDQSMSGSVKHKALKLLDKLPPEGRRLYELKYGTDARGLLEEALETGREEQLAQVVRRFFHTKAGAEAAYRLATKKLDNSEPLSAALHFKRLLQNRQVARRWEPALSVKAATAWWYAGYPERSADVLAALMDSRGGTRVTLGGKPVPLFRSQEDARRWLAGLLNQKPHAASAGAVRWPLFRGDPARNATSSPASPVWDSHWEFPTVRDEFAEPFEDPKQLAEADKQLRQFEELRRKEGVLTQPAGHPLIVGNQAIFRTMRNVRAVDIRTGELAWESIAVSEPYTRLVAEPDEELPTNGAQQETALQTLFAQRGWRDLAAGSLSSDGRYVYSLEELGFLGPYGNSRGGSSHPLAAKPYNKLTAYDLQAGGKLVWQAGGANEEGLAMAGSFFRGPPLPLDGKLYGIAEVSGDIRLVVLEVDAVATESRKRYEPRVQWTQSLVLHKPGMNIEHDALRRLSGASPSYADGILVCPTTAGAVIAVDLARRMLLWGYRYPRSVPELNLANNRIAIAQLRRSGGVLSSPTDDEDRWLDSPATIVDGKVLLTPRDSSELHCLNLLDGDPLWKQPRGGRLYLATADRQQVVLVGRTRVEALRLADGKPAWPASVSIDMPSGRGFRTGGLYHLPLTTGEIVTIDLTDGRIVARSQSRTGNTFGNLVSAGGMIVSQSVDEIVGFRGMEELQEQIRLALAEDPDDPQALSLRGEMLLHEGQQERGLADLRRSLQLQPNARTRQLVVATLLDGMRRDFARYRKFAPEIEQLVEDPEQRQRFLRLHAAGLHQIGESAAAFREYVKLTAADTGKPALEQMDVALSVRSDRWVRPRIAALYRQAAPEGKEAMQSLIDGLLEEALQGEQAAQQLRKFLQVFADLPAAERAGRALAEELDAEKQGLELELLLRRLRQSERKEIAAFATARLAKLYIRRERAAGLAPLLKELDEEFQETVCLDEKTGGQLSEQWRSQEQVAEMLRRQPAWPEKQLKAEADGRRRAVQRDFPVELKGSPGPFGEGWTLHVDSRKQMLIARDGGGEVLWQLPSNVLDRQIPQVYGNYARASGHLLVVVFGTHFVVLDALQPSGDPPVVLWQRDLVDGLDPRGIRFQWKAARGRARRVLVVQDRAGRPIGEVAIVGQSMVCYQEGTRLIAADALSGDTLWERRSVARGSEFFGDREFLFVVERGAEEAVVLRAADGERLGTRRLPPKSSWLSTDGRTMLVFSTSDGKGRLALFDAWRGKARWAREFAAGAEAFVIEYDEVALLEPAGRFVVLGLADGEIRIDSPAEPAGSLDNLLVQRSREQYVALTYGRQGNANNAVVVPPNTGDLLVNGRAYGFDRRTGEKLWSRNVANQTVDLSQPANLPILLLSSRTYSRLRGRGGLFNGTRYAMLILDKRTGKELYSERGTKPLSPLQVEVDRQQNQMQVITPQQVVELTLTEKPLQDEAESDPGPSSGAAQD